jgi:hypothetical protein
MAKDYFQDILQSNSGKPGDSFGVRKNEGELREEQETGGERSIRNITVNPRAPRPRAMSGDVRGVTPGAPQDPYGTPTSINKQKRLWMWVTAAVSIIVLLILGLFAFRDTTVTVMSRSRPIVFDKSVLFKAYPSASSATGTLSYTLVANDIEDSVVVASSGTERVEERATGTIEIFNAYSPTTVRLIKNTRFATPSGLVFRIPASVVIPGRKGETPGSVRVTVVAEQPGEQYNIGPIDRFTLPGLKTTPDMYTSVYARSASAFTGGFVGDRPSVALGALDETKSVIRGKLESKTRESALALTSETAIVFPDLIRITYESLPSTTEAGGGVRIHEKARVVIPVFPLRIFAQTVASGVGEVTDGVSFQIIGLEKIVAGLGGTSTAQAYGTDSIDFTLSGNALLVWDVDTTKLAEALEGRDEGAFQAIIKGFSSIQEARARIQPFWKGSFPASASDIKIELSPVKVTQNP